MPYVKKAELVEILAGLGETAPVKWTREQILLRIQEIEEETKVAPKDTKVTDEVQELRRALNKAARKKSDLQAFCTQQLGLELTMNETIEKLKVKAESVLAQKAPPRGDELMGFGKHAGLSFGQVMMNHHDYVSWAVQSYHEGPVNWRLERFVSGTSITPAARWQPRPLTRRLRSQRWKCRVPTPRRWERTPR